MYKLRLGACILGLTLFAASPGMAALIDATDPELTGTGLGAVLTIVTAQDNGSAADGLETGCVGWDGSDTIGSCVSGFEGAGGDEKTGASQTLTRALSEVSGLDTIADIGLIVNLNEPGNDGSINLLDLYFTIFSADGTAEIFTAFLDPESIELINGSGSGIGKSGFLFILDDAQRITATTAQTGAGGFSGNWRIGGGFLAEDIAGGPETVFVFRAPGGNIPPDDEVPPIPEPSSFLLIGGGLLAAALLGRRHAG